jgi:hypothetical protein
VEERDAVMPNPAIGTIAYRVNPWVKGGATKIEYRGEGVWQPPCGEVVVNQWGGSGSPLRNITPAVVGNPIQAYGKDSGQDNLPPLLDDLFPPGLIFEFTFFGGLGHPSTGVAGAFIVAGISDESAAFPAITAEAQGILAASVQPSQFIIGCGRARYTALFKRNAANISWGDQGTVGQFGLSSVLWTAGKMRPHVHFKTTSTSDWCRVEGIAITSKGNL